MKNLIMKDVRADFQMSFYNNIIANLQNLYLNNVVHKIGRKFLIFFEDKIKF